MSTTLVWFRNDLRVSDNPALYEAAQRGAVVPVYVLDDAGEAPWAMGAASRWWLHHSLASLHHDLMLAYQVPLLLVRGAAKPSLLALAAQYQADGIVWNRRYEPASIARDRDIKQAFKDKGLAAESYHASLLLEPWEVSNQQGQPFKVFTPFWKHCLSTLPPAPPLPAPARLTVPQPLLPCDNLRDWCLLPTQPDWAGGMREAWQVGEAAAMTRLQTFLEDGLQRYDGGRDIPSEANTSRLSPYLHFGEISPRQVWYHVMKRAPLLGAHVSKYLSELGWREFAHHLLYHFPTFPERPFNAKFEAFAWQTNPQHWAAWCKGETGYPLVDAGMRELWHTGWMHNRVRMVVASFLTKHLRIAWHEGQAWFWDTLVDANLANNSASWQWVAGCGADAAPYFRIFNPFTQSEKFDPQGIYIRRWVPELRGLSAQEIHKPWSHAPRYARPIVVHEEARQAALAAYQDLK